MELLRAALQRQAHGCAGGDAIVRRIVRRHHRELSDGVLRRHDVHAAGAAAVIGFATVDQPDVVALTKAVHADGEVRCDRSRRVRVRQRRADTQTQCCQSRKVAVLSRDLADLLGADQCADHVRVGLYRKRICLHRYRLGFGAYRKLDVRAGSRGYVHHDAVLGEGLEALGHDLHVVVGGVQTGDVIQAGFAACCRLGESSCGIGENDLRIRDHCSCLIGDYARQLGVRLRECYRAGERKDQGQQK